MWRHKHVQKIRTQRNVSYPKQNRLGGGGAKIDSPLNLSFSLLTNMLKIGRHVVIYAIYYFVGNVNNNELNMISNILRLVPEPST